MSKTKIVILIISILLIVSVPIGYSYYQKKGNADSKIKIMDSCELTPGVTINFISAIYHYAPARADIKGKELILVATINNPTNNYQGPFGTINTFNTDAFDPNSQTIKLKTPANKLAQVAEIYDADLGWIDSQVPAIPITAEDGGQAQLVFNDLKPILNSTSELMPKNSELAGILMFGLDKKELGTYTIVCKNKEIKFELK